VAAGGATRDLIVERDWYGELEPGFLTVNTVEVADPRMGGSFRF